MANPGTDASLDINTYSGALKTYYDKINFEQLVYQHFPALGIIPKDEKLQGKNWQQPVAFAQVPNRSHTFAIGQNPWYYANANTGATSSLTAAVTQGIGFPQVTAFTVTPVQDYAFAYIDRMTKLASETKEGAFLEAATESVDMAMKAVMMSLATGIYGAGTGTIGQINSVTTSAANGITLKDINQVVNFYVGQVVMFSSTDGGACRGSLAQGSGAMIVAVNRELGTLVFGTVLASGTTGYTAVALSSLVSGAVSGDYIVAAGDGANGGANISISGFQAWIPATAPATSDSFFGVNRSSDTKLSGVIVDGTGLPLEEGLIEVSAAVGREGGTPDICFMNFSNWTLLQFALGAKKVYFQPVKDQVKSSDGNIGYTSIVIEGPKGPIDVVPDPFCPSGNIYVLQKDTWQFKSYGKCPHLFDVMGGDSGEMPLLRIVNADAYEARCGYYGNMSNCAPGWNGLLSVTPSAIL